MRIHLLTSPYHEKNPLRRVELEQCFDNNLRAGFDYFTYVMEDGVDFDCGQKLISDALIRVPENVRYQRLIRTEGRPKFRDYISCANEAGEEMIHVVCNSDIYFTSEDVEKIRNLPWEKNLFVALSRWDQTAKGNLVLLDRPDTADAWCWKGKSPIINMQCSCGNPGVDNHLAWLAKEAGYYVVNPSRDIKARHLHNVKGNNYRVDSKPDGAIIADQICPEPYYFHKPIHISEI
jgi:hypothetical protein